MPAPVAFKVNMKPLFAALQEFQKTSRKDFSANLELAGRGVIKNVVAITPPNRASSNADGEGGLTGGVQARKQGEAAIMADLRRIFFPASDGFMAKFLHANPDGTKLRKFRYAQAKKRGADRTKGEVVIRVMSLAEMKAYHKSKKGSNGRVRGGGEGGRLNFKHAEQLKTGLNKAQIASLDYAIVKTADFKDYAKVVKERVGWLGHGWGPAASRLKVTLPTYIARHESSHGSIQIDLGPTKFRIKAANNIGWASDVKGYARRLQDAVNRQADAFRKRTYFWLQKRAARLAAKT